jgi:hypothetical protein
VKYFPAIVYLFGPQRLSKPFDFLIKKAEQGARLIQPPLPWCQFHQEEWYVPLRKKFCWRSVQKSF